MVTSEQLSMDFEKEIHQILQVIPRDRKTFLFSATMTTKVAKLQKASLINPVKIEISTKFQTPKVWFLSRLNLLMIFPDLNSAIFIYPCEVEGLLFVIYFR